MFGSIEGQFIFFYLSSPQLLSSNRGQDGRDGLASLDQTFGSRTTWTRHQTGRQRLLLR